MPSQIMGYYSARKEKLLKNFYNTSVLIKASLVARYGKKFTSTLQREVRQEYEKLIPDIPYIKGSRARLLNSFLLITAQELAAYKAMKKHGKLPGEAWELCHEVLRFRLAEIPQWKAVAVEAFHVFSPCKEDCGEASPATAKGSFRRL